MTETRAEPFTPAERAVMAARAEAQQMRAERDAAVRSVAALFHAYIAITPGETLEGLEPQVQAQADELLGYLIELEARHSDVLALTAPLADENANLRAQLAETSARLADLARQATAAGPVLEAAEAWAACGGDALEDYALRRELRRAVAALRAAREGGSK